MSASTNVGRMKIRQDQFMRINDLTATIVATASFAARGRTREETLNPTFLTEPTVQFSVSPDPASAAGVWTNATATSNYLSLFNGHVIGNTGGTNPTVPPAATWTLNSPLTGITGIRLIGSEGGLAAAQGGF